MKGPLRTMAEENPPPLREDARDAKNQIRMTPTVVIPLTRMRRPIRTRRRRARGKLILEDVHIGAEDSTVRSENMDMLSRFRDMWSGRLGKIDATKHRIELKPGARPMYQVPYRAGPIACEKDKKEIDRMLRPEVIEPTLAEWASPVELTSSDRKVFLIYDGYRAHLCLEFLKTFANNNVALYSLPVHTSGKTQAPDTVLFSSFKNDMKRICNNLKCTSRSSQLDIFDFYSLMR